MGANRGVSAEEWPCSPVVMSGCESWAMKKAERLRTDAFELWCWRRLLRVPWTARRSNQSILKEISPEYSWEGWMLKLKLQYFGRLMWRASSLEKTQKLGKIEDRRRRVTEDEMVGWHHRLNGHEFEQTPGGGKGQGTWRAAGHGFTKSWTRLSDWTITVNCSLRRDSEWCTQKEPEKQNDHLGHCENNLDRADHHLDWWGVCESGKEWFWLLIYF